MNVDAASASREELQAIQTSQLGVIWHHFRRHRAGLIALAIFSLLVLSTIIVPLLSPFDQNANNGLIPLAPAGTVDPNNSLTHILGTDSKGRDNLTRLFFAGQASLIIAFTSALSVVALGATIGAVAGLYGGWVDSLIMRVTDFMLALPLLPMYLFVIRIIRGLVGFEFSKINNFNTIATMVLIFVVFGWMGIARLVRGSILSLRSQAFVEAARALGASNRRLIFKHLIPNSIAPVLVAATFAVGDFIIMEAVISYFGLGVTDPPTPSWGNLLGNNQSFTWSITNLNPTEDIRGYLVLLPSLMVFVAVLCVNYIGDALRDALDPRLHF